MSQFFVMDMVNNSIAGSICESLPKFILSEMTKLYPDTYDFYSYYHGRYNSWMLNGDMDDTDIDPHTKEALTKWAMANYNFSDAKFKKIIFNNTKLLHKAFIDHQYEIDGKWSEMQNFNPGYFNKINQYVKMGTRRFAVLKYTGDSANLRQDIRDGKISKADLSIVPICRVIDFMEMNVGRLHRYYNSVIKSVINKTIKPDLAPSYVHDDIRGTKCKLKRFEDESTFVYRNPRHSGLRKANDAFKADARQNENDIERPYFYSDDEFWNWGWGQESECDEYINDFQTTMIYDPIIYYCHMVKIRPTINPDRFEDLRRSKIVKCRNGEWFTEDMNFSWKNSKCKKQWMKHKPSHKDIINSHKMRA